MVYYRQSSFVRTVWCPLKCVRTVKHVDILNHWVGLLLLGFNASATARVRSRRRNDDDEISFLVEETGIIVK